MKANTVITTLTCHLSTLPEQPHKPPLRSCPTSSTATTEVSIKKGHTTWNTPIIDAINQYKSVNQPTAKPPLRQPMPQHVPTPKERLQSTPQGQSQPLPNRNHSASSNPAPPQAATGPPAWHPYRSQPQDPPEWPGPKYEDHKKFNTFNTTPPTDNYEYGSRYQHHGDPPQTADGDRFRRAEHARQLTGHIIVPEFGTCTYLSLIHI